jgi:hypothetical protein
MSPSGEVRASRTLRSTHLARCRDTLVTATVARQPRKYKVDVVAEGPEAAAVKGLFLEKYARPETAFVRLTPP